MEYFKIEFENHDVLFFIASATMKELNYITEIRNGLEANGWQFWKDKYFAYLSDDCFLIDEHRKVKIKQEWFYENTFSKNIVIPNELILKQLIEIAKIKIKENGLNSKRYSVILLEHIA